MWTQGERGKEGRKLVKFSGCLLWMTPVKALCNNQNNSKNTYFNHFNLMIDLYRNSMSTTF